MFPWECLPEINLADTNPPSFKTATIVIIVTRAIRVLIALHRTPIKSS